MASEKSLISLSLGCPVRLLWDVHEAGLMTRLPTTGPHEC